ncbi:MAG: cyanoexosortase A system-associated protein [Snowella sp.]|nr:cyanoexosortase A system-associated protein [Snowella sp.]
MKLSDDPKTTEDHDPFAETVTSPPLSQWRKVLLGLLLGGAALTLIKVVFYPNPNTVNPLPFPSEVPLVDWQLEKTSDAEKVAQLSQPEADKLLSFVNGKIYQYRQGNQVLTVKMRYFAPSIGDVKAFLTYYHKNVPDSLVIRNKEGLGSYGLFSQDQQAHLTTCLTPRGGSIFKREQFLQVRYSSDLRLERLLPIAIGKTSLLDNRCLWIDISLSGTDSSSPSSYYPTLEKIWISWNQWWQPYFEGLQI